MPHVVTYVNSRHKFTVYPNGDAGELYDLLEDPNELHNLWNEPAASGLKTAMLHEMLQGFLVSGPMKMPRLAQAYCNYV